MALFLMCDCFPFPCQYFREKNYSQTLKLLADIMWFLSISRIKKRETKNWKWQSVSIYHLLNVKFLNIHLAICIKQQSQLTTFGIEA